MPQLIISSGYHNFHKATTVISYNESKSDATYKSNEEKPKDSDTV
jgi:hypothetical protein